MTESYYTEDQKLCKLNTPKWSFDECILIQDILINKGYLVNCVSRRGCDRKYHDAWHVKRADVPRLIEQLFRQRFTVVPARVIHIEIRYERTIPEEDPRM